MSTRGFLGRRPSDEVAHRLPPGQYQTEDFPVLAKGPTPRVDPAVWRFTIKDGSQPLASWTWAEFEALPQTIWRGDIHCVTKWSKFDTIWRGVTIDDLFRGAGITPPSAYLLAESHDDYDTNLAVADLVDGKAMIATRFAGTPPGVRARRPGATSRSAPVFLEEREMDQGPSLHHAQRGRVLGAARLSHGRRSVARATLHERPMTVDPSVTPGPWQQAVIERIVPRTPPRHQRFPANPAGVARSGSARRRPPHGIRRLSGATQLLDRFGSRDRGHRAGCRAIGGRRSLLVLS